MIFESRTQIVFSKEEENVCFSRADLWLNVHFNFLLTQVSGILLNLLAEAGKRLSFSTFRSAVTQ